MKYHVKIHWRLLQEPFKNIEVCLVRFISGMKKWGWEQRTYDI